jgi:hypothetical protein
MQPSHCKVCRGTGFVIDSSSEFSNKIVDCEAEDCIKQRAARTLEVGVVKQQIERGLCKLSIMASRFRTK